MSNQSDKQASVRAITGTALDYNGDWSALFDVGGIAAGPFDGRFLAWLNAQLSATYTNLPGAMNAYAVSQGFTDWASMGTFGVGPPAAPTNVSVPVISGIQTRGQTLTASNGTWTGAPTSFAYQWKRAGVDIGSATNQTYVLALADVGAVITVSVVATNATGSSSPAVSAGTSAIAALLTISGTPVTSATQNTAYTGFSVAGAGGHTAYVYSISSGTLPAGITLNSSTGAVAGTPTAVETQSGIVIRVTDADGLTADLAAFAIAVAIPVPVNSVVPTISGVKTNGQTLTATTGTWSNTPTGYAYQWKRGVTNVGTNSSTYLLVTGDVASTMTVTVTASNASGAGTPAVSTATSAIAAVLSISGTPVTTATQNSAYTGFSASGAGGHTAYVYSVQSGALPTGLSLNSATGAVSGTPTLVETQTGIVIRVTDADGLTADLASFQIAVSASTNFVTDTFTDTDGTALTSHTGEVGATWAPQQALVGATTPAATIASNRAYSAITGSYYPSGAPATADYSVTAVFDYISTVANEGIGLAARMTINTSGITDQYRLLFAAATSTWTLTRRTATNATVGSYVDSAFVAGQTRTVKLECIGSTITAYFDGVSQITGTEATITAAGHPGLHLASTAGATSTTGIHCTSFTADNA